MKRWVIAGAGVLVWMAAVSSAGAADIPAAPAVKAPVAVPVTQSWYGFYIGANGGYAWGNNSVEFGPDAFYGPLLAGAGIPLSLAGKPQGWLGGITYGSNYQFQNFVIGLDSDFDWSNIKASQSFSGTVTGVPFTATASHEIKWFSTTRARAGFVLADHWLLYGTGGLATARVDASANNVLNVAGLCAITAGGCPAGSLSKTMWGWAAGAGIEYASGPWQFRVEYLHYDLGTLNFAMRDFVAPLNVINASVHERGDMVRGAITYRFNWTLLGLLFGTDRM
jgi:outer membrane immunogenic protein